MEEGSILVYSPICGAVVFGFFGMEGTWRRAFLNILFLYVGLVVASQHNHFLAGLASSSDDPEPAVSAVVFGGTVTAVYLGLHILYRIMWAPREVREGTHGFFTSSARFVMMLVVGWLLGVIFLMSAMGAEAENNRFDTDIIPQPLYREAVVQSFYQTGSWSRMWVPGEMPPLYTLSGYQTTTYEVEEMPVRLIGGWQRRSSDYTSTGYYAYADGTASVEMNFTGSTLQLQYLVFPSFGIFNVYVDDRLVEMVDSYNPTSDVVLSEIWTLEPGEHRLRIQNTGSRNPQSQGSTIALDTIIVGD